jgi:hypothetical protein
VYTLCSSTTNFTTVLYTIHCIVLPFGMYLLHITPCKHQYSSRQSQSFTLTSSPCRIFFLQWRSPASSSVITLPTWLAVVISSKRPFANLAPLQHIYIDSRRRISLALSPLLLSSSYLLQQLCFLRTQPCG